MPPQVAAAPDKRKSQHARCPECREEILINKGGVAKLKTSLKLRNLAERRRKDISQKDQAPKSPEFAICPVHDGETMRLYCDICR